MRARPISMLLLPVLMCLPVSAQNQPQPAAAADTIDVMSYALPRVYRGQSVVRVHTTSQSQLVAVLDLAQDVWSERVGVGELDIAIMNSDLPRLRALRIPAQVRIDDLQAHADEGWSRIVAQTRLERARGGGFQRGGSVHDESWFDNYRQLSEIETYTQNIATLRPDMASISVIGQSWEGRDMHAITITAPDAPGNAGVDRPAVYIFSTVHAREWIAPMTTCYIASRLVSDYGSDPTVTDILDHTRIVIVPIGNPDGYLYTWSNQRYWRNTRRDNGDGTFGVNINRNWGYEWGNQGSSGSTGNTNYRGTEPFSEPETRALRDVALTLGDKLVAHIDYHSYSQLIMWPFGYENGVVTPTPAAWALTALATDMAQVIEDTTGASYVPEQLVELYPAAGNSPDWFFGELGKTSYTIELRPHNSDFNPPPETILPCAQENYEAFKVFVRRTTAPYNIYYPYSHPPTILANEIYPIYATVFEGLGLATPASVTLYSRVEGEGEYQPTPAEILSEPYYTGRIAELPCGSYVEYYFQATSPDGRTATAPLDGPEAPLRALLKELVPTHIDTMETDTGWIVGAPGDTATQGIWTLAVPEPTTAQPGEDHTPDGTMCWVTDAIAGDSDDANDVDGGRSTLISPRFSATYGDEFSFWFSFSQSDTNPDDTCNWSVSNDDGATWVSLINLWETGGAWSYWRLPVDAVLEPTDFMRVRFVVEDGGEDSLVEAAIDDFHVEHVGCPGVSPADINADGVLNFFDVSAFIVAYQNQDPVADFFHDGYFTFFDVASFLNIFLAG